VARGVAKAPSWVPSCFCGRIDRQIIREGHYGGVTKVACNLFQVIFDNVFHGRAARTAEPRGFSATTKYLKHFNHQYV